MTAPTLDAAPDLVAALAERAYVGACLHLRGQEARDALARVKVADLAAPQLRAVLEALLRLVVAGLPVTPAALLLGGIR